MLQAGMHAFILALGLILPLGVQNLFVFNQGAAQHRFRQALPAVITASICDTILIGLAVLGVSVFLLKIVWIKTIFLLAGVCFLLYMGYVMWKSKPAVSEDEERIFSPKKQIVFAMSVSLLNPHAIMDTVGVIGTSSMLYSDMEKYVFTAVCMVVSWIWFTALAIIGKITGMADKSGRLLGMLNKLSAFVMWGMAILMLLSLR
ncbi:LysE/ArgO family amino acid transporter [Niallia sp. 03133]|uniref:LysE/ArgO family amino acid transporter n=1 Tax=Niallia sp. 03133 TaxID=3458060 RepID=UPI00404405BC